MKTSALVREEIERRFGFFPPFFEPAMETPDILENLWQQTLSAYVNNPIPPLFKEKLFAYLSRFCSIPYCIVCHSCALRPMRMTAQDVLKMLEEPAPYDEIEIRAQISLLNATNPLDAWPERDSELEESLFACSVFIFLDPSRSEQCRSELRRVLGTPYYNRLIEFLSYVKTCHLWVEAHPEISYEADKRAVENLGPLLRENPPLAEFFKNYNEKIVMEVRKREDKLKAALDNMKNYDKTIKESEELFRSTFEQAAVGIAHIAPDGRWLRVNQKLCDIVGYSKEELLKLTFQDITHPDDLDADLGYVRQVLADEIKTYSMEKRYYRKDGSIVWINLTVSLLREPSGAPKYFISVVEDISERKKTEEALEKSEARLRAIVNALPDIAFILDEKGRYVEVLAAPRSKPLLYSAIQDLKGRLLHDVLPRDDADKFLSVIHKTIETEEPQVIEYELSVQAGRRWFEGRTAPLPIQSENRMVVWVSRDITERRKADEEREKMQRLESIGILAGGIAHDFNNLLAGILGNIDLAKMHVKPGDKLYKRLEDTETASLRARDLTQQLLTFSKGGEPVKKDFSVSALLRDSVGFTLSGSNVRCEYLIPEDLWPVNADEGQINQVISNLVINAVQAMPGGGLIIASCENTAIGSKDAIPLKKGQYVKITLRDQGTGIHEEHLAKIFDPYFTTKERGKGLGLATCYSIIKRHDGYITVESQLGVGTAFHIYLPASPDAVLAEKAEEEKPFISRGRILVMDDEEIVRMVATEMLSTLGHEVAVAKDGAEAIELYIRAKASGLPFDAVIMDLTIPGGMGGKEAIGRLKEIDPAVKVIVSSGYSNDPIMAHHQEYGFVGSVIKPYMVKDLSEALHKALQVK